MATDRTFRDSQGKRLVDYPRPSVAVDTAVLTLDPGPDSGLAVLLVRRSGSHRKGEWALPGAFLLEEELLAAAVARSLREKAGVEGVAPRQLHVFDDPQRDGRGWVLTVAYVDLVPFLHVAGTAAERDDVRIVPVDQVGDLPYGHAEIVAAAVAEVRARYAVAPDPAHLLPRTFTIRDLRLLHEAVAGCRLMRDTFRRVMEPQLKGTGRLSSGTVGRPAELFRRL
ncbi:MAG: NrtR DNA-binding winged helix domain-containing protein [Sporichthyaceae bacterium]